MYLDLRGYAPEPPVPPIDALARFLRALGVPAEQVPPEVGEAGAMYRSLLADKRVLVVLDNAAGPEQVRPLLPGGSGSLVLVTSRDQLAGLVARDGAHRLCLDGLAPDEAGGLLGRMLGTARAAAEPEAVAELAALCGHLPLALRIAGANLAAHPSHRIAAHVEQVRGRDRIATLAVLGDPQLAVATAFDHSYRRLPDDARRMFRLVGLVPGPDLTTAAAAALADRSQVDAGRLLAALAGAHLVDERTPGRYACHDLLRSYAADCAEREASGPDRAAARARLYGYYLDGTDAAARAAYPQFTRLPRTGPEPASPVGVEFDDVAAAVSWLDAECDNLVAAVYRGGPPLRAQVVRIADDLRGYFWLRLNAAQWHATALAAVAAAEAAGDQHGQAAGQLSLAMLHRRQGRQPEASAHATRARTAAAAAGWDDGEATAASALGAVHEQAGRLAAAADQFHQALARFAPDHPGTTIVLTNLSIVHLQTGQLAQAAAQARRALGLNQRLGSTTGEAINHLTLGQVSHLRGKLGPAVDDFTRAVDQCRRVGAGPVECIGLANLAAAHQDAGRLGAALETASAAVAVAQDGGDVTAEAGCRAVLAGAQLRLGHGPAELPECQRALELARRAPARFLETEALTGLSAIYRSVGEPEPGAECARQSLAIARECGFRVLAGDALTALAAAQLAAGDTDQAVALSDQAQELLHAIGCLLGEARGLVVLGQARHRIGDRDAADRHRQRARDLFAEVGAAAAAEVAALLGDPAPDDDRSTWVVRSA